jgi:diaminohydroxyphosphoribosylaminopyrimidine deaminase/5-amino-6-(5-phosphoribosylamino)uracil reductase
MFTPADHIFMQRAICLAALGGKAVRPNPLVGALLVYNNTIIGEGFHKQYGAAHAEVNAIDSVQDKTLIPDSTLYVTLEPCNHFGKTPPCTELIIKRNIKKVVVATKDPNPLVSGKGIQRLEAAGVNVSVGLCAGEAEWQNRRFFCAHRRKRPYIILKWAQSANGFMASERKSPIWISNVYSRKWVHKWRSEEDAIMVGPGTLLHDNPQLTTRDWPGAHPVRVSYSLQSTDIFSKPLHFFDKSTTSLFYSTEQINTANCHVIQLNGQHFFKDMFEHLLTQGIQSVLVEGGVGLLHTLITQNLWDEARIFVGNVMLKNGIAAPAIYGQLEEKLEIAGDTLRILSNNNSYSDD